MDAHEIATLRRLMEYEAARTAPPPGFPKLPDLPGGRYTDQRFFQLEKSHVWRKSWLLAGHIDEIAEPGSFKLWETAGQPIVLVHARSGLINAFYNTCSHRGAPVVTEQSGKRALLTCKYHGWTYDDEGRLVAIRDQEDFADFDFSCRSLVQVRCERFGNLIFVNFDEGAPSLLEWLGPIAEEWAEFRFDTVRLVDRYVWDLDSNWKIAMEANTEVYHVKSIHPVTLAPGLDDRRNINTLYPNGHGRMIAPTRGEKLDVTRSRPKFEIDSVGEIARTCTQSYGIFPNWVSPLGASGFPVLLFWPNGIDKCRMEVWWFGADWGTGEKPAAWAETRVFFDRVLREDTEFGRWIQKSQESYGFRGVPLSYQEARIYHWNQWADRMIGIGNIPPELRVQQVIGDEWMYPSDPRLALIDPLGAAE
jgi:phenylpropionate dioxygenase-like ring-hydroxylating dioxygenase large terminal subunit